MLDPPCPDAPAASASAQLARPPAKPRPAEHVVNCLPAVQNKRRGLLSLTSRWRLLWSEVDSSAVAEISLAAVDKFFAARGAAKPALRLVLRTGETFTFVFASVDDCDIVRDFVSNVVGALARSSSSSSSSAATAPAAPNANGVATKTASASISAVSPNERTPGGRNTPLHSLSSSSSSCSSSSSSSLPSLASVPLHAIGGHPPPPPPPPSLASLSLNAPPITASPAFRPLTSLPPREELALRSRLLATHRGLLRLHQELVGEGLVDENDFWVSRRFLLQSAALEACQSRGVPSASLADHRPVSKDGGEVKFTVTPQLINSIFAQNPTIKKLYEEQVPLKISEATFWERYFRSKMAQQQAMKNKTAILERDALSAAATGEVDEPISDARLGAVNATLNLQSTVNDNLLGIDLVADHTMRFSKSSVSLLRQFNMRSQSVLQSLGYFQNEKNSESSVESEIVMDHLINAEKEISLQLPLKSASDVLPKPRHSEQSLQEAESIAVARALNAISSLEKEQPLGFSVVQDDVRKAHEELALMYTAKENLRIPKELQENEVPKEILTEFDALWSRIPELLRHFYSARHENNPDKQKKLREVLITEYESMDWGPKIRRASTNESAMLLKSGIIQLRKMLSKAIRAS